MDSHGQYLDNDLLRIAVAGVLHEVRYQCSVIRDFDLPSNYVMKDTKIPTKRKKAKTNSRLKRNKDKDRKRKERLLLKHTDESITLSTKKTTTTRFQRLYKTNERYKENKKTYSKDK